MSKKERKKLAKLQDQRKKNENRATLVEALSSVQLPATQLAEYVSLSTMQTAGLKKLKQVKKAKISPHDEGPAEEIINLKLSGSKKRRLELLSDILSSDDEPDSKKQKDYNVVGFESSSTSDDAEDQNEPMTRSPPPPAGPIEPKPEIQPVKVEPLKPNEEPQRSNIVDRKPAVYVHVDRDPKIQAARLKLPILAEEQVVMETISDNDVVIIAGETGSGKTTQVPQFLYEAGYAQKKMIGITEPRRVAAISMSKRVANEMNLSSDIVSYLMRFEGNVTDKTKIKFMTDGVLLKEVETDFLLKKYSVIILDEAHERSVFTDILVGLLSRIILVRRKSNDPLRLIIMSATLRVEDFTGNRILFKNPPPVLKVDSRQYPVTVHFNKVTAADYVKEAYNKVVKIHTKLPEGGILVFVTGQKEVRQLVHRLRKTFPYKPQLKGVQANNGKKIKESTSEDSFDEEDWDMVKVKKIKVRKKKVKSVQKKKKPTELPKVNLDLYRLPNERLDKTQENFDDEEMNSDDSNLDDDEDQPTPEFVQSQPMWVLPLYSVLSSEKQALVFQDPPEGCRFCVIATNVAETSITIPHIKYVVDSGRQKSRIYDKMTGVSSFVVTYTSKASANQRAGRAGRVGPGDCYRLYSSAVYNDEFQEFSPPEIQEKPIDDLMLQMKVIGIEKVSKFPFPSPPDQTQLDAAETRLKMLGALQDKTLIKGNTTETVVELTKLGRNIARFPVSPRFGKMLALSNQGGLLPYMVILVASLSIPNVFVENLPEVAELANDEEDNENEDNEEKNKARENQEKYRTVRHKWAGDGESRLLGDAMVLLKAVGACLFEKSKANLEKFCLENGIRAKAIQEIMKILQQLTNDINLNTSDVSLCIDPDLPPPSDEQIRLIRQVLLSGLGDKVAQKFTKQEINNMEDKARYRNAYKCINIEDPVYLHRESALKYEEPEWIVYQEAYEVDLVNGRRMFLRGVTAIEPEWLPKYVPSLCNVLKILDKPEPRFDQDSGEILCHVNASFSKGAWMLPQVEMSMPKSLNLYKLFAKFFLAGIICPALEEFVPSLLATPDTMTKNWSKLMSRAGNLLDSLMAYEVTNKEVLVKKWKADKTCK